MTAVELPVGGPTLTAARRPRWHDRDRRPRTSRAARRRERITTVALLAGSTLALAAFGWPLVAYAVPAQAQAAVPAAAFALAAARRRRRARRPRRHVRTAHSLALLGMLAAIGAAIRIVGTGVGGVEAVFVLLILAGRAFGARFGLLLGLLAILLSSVVAGGIGPWTPFQMFACAWVGAGAGLLLPRRRDAGAARGRRCCSRVRRGRRPTRSGSS